MTSPTEKRVRLWLDEQEHELRLVRAGAADSFEIEIERDGATQRRSLRLLRGGPAPLVLVEGRVLRLALFEQGGERLASFESAAHRVRAGHGGAAIAQRAAPSTGLVVAPMPGRVVAIRVSVGEAVEKGALLLVVEAMKMQNELYSAGAGRVQEVLIGVGDTVERGAALVRIG